MAKLPYMPLWIDDLTLDTRHLSPAQFGVYMRVLCHMWRQGGTLPDDDLQLQRLVGVDNRNWPSMRQMLDQFLQRTPDGRLTQKRLAEVLQQQALRYSHTVTAAEQRWQKAGKPLKSKQQADASAMQTHMQTEMRMDMPMQSQPEPEEPSSKGDDGSGSPLPPENAKQSASPRFASPLGAARSAQPPVGSQAAFVERNQPKGPPGIERAIARGDPVPGWAGLSAPPGLMEALGQQPTPEPPPEPSLPPVKAVKAMTEDELREHMAKLVAKHDQPATGALMKALKAKREQDR